MTHLRRLNYSARISTVLVASLTFLSDTGLERLGLFLFPGQIVEFILTTLLPFGDGEAFGYTHNGWAANLAVYFLAFYLLLLLFQALQWFYRELQSEAKHCGTNSIQQALGADSP